MRVPLLVLCSLASACATPSDATSEKGPACPTDDGEKVEMDYADGLDLACPTLAWGTGELLAEAREEWAPDAYVASATCDVVPLTGLIRGNGCVAYFASPSVVGEHATCILPFSPRCEANPDNTDGYQPGERVDGWRVDSSIATTLDLDSSTLDAEMSVFTITGSRTWPEEDGPVPSADTPLLGFPGGTVVDGRTGEVLVVPEE